MEADKGIQVPRQVGAPTLRAIPFRFCPCSNPPVLFKMQRQRGVGDGRRSSNCGGIERGRDADNGAARAAACIFKISDLTPNPPPLLSWDAGAKPQDHGPGRGRRITAVII